MKSDLSGENAIEFYAKLCTESRCLLSWFAIIDVGSSSESFFILLFLMIGNSFSSSITMNGIEFLPDLLLMLSPLKVRECFEFLECLLIF